MAIYLKFLWIIIIPPQSRIRQYCSCGSNADQSETLTKRFRFVGGQVCIIITDHRGGRGRLVFLSDRDAEEEECLYKIYILHSGNGSSHSISDPVCSPLVFQKRDLQPGLTDHFKIISSSAQSSHDISEDPLKRRQCGISKLPGFIVALIGAYKEKNFLLRTFFNVLRYLLCGKNTWICV